MSSQHRSSAADVDKWRQVRVVLDILDVAGMSSDESDDGGPPYRRRESSWASVQLKTMLRALDTYMDHMHANGKHLPGNKPRIRLEPDVTMPISSTYPPPCLPVNFVDSSFVQHLPFRVRNQVLKPAKQDVTIPNLLPR